MFVKPISSRPFWKTRVRICNLNALDLSNGLVQK
jgi:hypothetical protein